MDSVKQTKKKKICSRLESAKEDWTGKKNMLMEGNAKAELGRWHA